MSWNNNDGQNNGPWGPFGGNQGPKKEQPENPNPWSRKSSNTGGPSDNQGRPPDLSELMNKLNAFFNRKDRQPYNIAFTALAVLFGLWLLSGFYQVATDQVGVVMRFGAYDRTEPSGLHYHLPEPIEEVLLPVVTSQNEIQIGFRRTSRNGGEMKTVPEESLMLTQDENIINVQFTVFWRVNDVQKFLFEIRDPEQTIKMGAESVMRDVIGQNKLEFALTDGRGQIADVARERLQSLMDEYNAGIVVSQINLQTVAAPDEVKAAFQDVVNARLDQERFQNQAAAHVNNVIPNAKGQAAQIVQQAMAYRDQKVAIAQGEAARFKEVLGAYDNAKDVTARRLYLETMETILSNTQKIIVDKNAGGGGVPYFPLRDLMHDKQRPTDGTPPDADKN
jgi:membrane protease subunit HflK